MNNCWRIYVYFKIGMNLVSFWIASAYSFEDAWEWAYHVRPFPHSKKRGVLFKKLGDGRRIYSWDDYHEWYGWEHEEADEDTVEHECQL